MSVVGTFNHWDGRHHPMSVRGDSGIWELFIPELRAGELYKYEILGRQTRELFLKTDPFGALFEHRPATASVTTPKSAFAWTDGEWMRRRERSATGSASRCRSTRFISARGAAARPADS